MEFGRWVQEERKRRRMTETECALRAGMKLQQWNRMEKTARGVHLRTLHAVARGLEADLEEVMEGAGHPRNTSEPGSFALKIQAYLDRLPPERRDHFARALEHTAEIWFAAY